MSEPEKVPDIIIDRAVDMWCRAIKSPKFDNGDDTIQGTMTARLHSRVLDSQLSEVDDFAASVERFRQILSDKLKYQRDHEGELTGETASYGPVTHRLNRRLSTDYGPDRELAEAATAAGLPTSVFSWKSDVSFWQNDSVSVRLGYGATEMYHYPLTDGAWLICELQGKAMALIIRAVEEGRLPELTVERVHG